jgi:hypothetical protein
MLVADVYGEFPYRKDIAVPSLVEILKTHSTSLPQAVRCSGLLLDADEKIEVTVVVRESSMTMREALKRASP